MKKITCFTFLFLSMLSCSFSQEKASFEIEEMNNLAYLPTDKTVAPDLQALNLVLPKGSQAAPLLIWIGGGAWSYVDRHQEMNLARQLAKSGIAVASIGHRLSPATWQDPKKDTGVEHPKHIEDLAAAVKWLYANADQYTYDTEKIFVGGFSSGAQLAALIGMAPQYLEAQGLSPDLFKGIIPVSGAFDIANYHQVFLDSERPELAELHVEAVFGKDSAAWKQASPVNYLEGFTTPLLLLADNGVFRYTNLFEEHLREAAIQDVQVIYSYDLSHADLWKDLSNNPESKYLHFMQDFIWEQLKAESAN